MDVQEEKEAIAFATVFHKVPDYQTLPEEEQKEEEEEEVTSCRSSSSTSEDFEFSFAPNFKGVAETNFADGIFYNGEFQPVYPVFNRKLVEERDDLKDMEFSFRRVSIGNGKEDRNTEKLAMKVPEPESYCEWILKSKSTGGSSSRKWNLMDFVVGRSHSDGKQKFLFLSPPPAATAANTESVVVDKKKKTTKNKKKNEEVRVREMDMVTAHKLYYGRDGGVGERKQQSYLPYRRSLVEFRPF